MAFLTRAQRDDLRTAILAELVAARTVALSAEMLARRLVRTRLLSFEFDLSAVQAEIEALHARGFVQTISDAVSDTPHYQATSAGVLAHERAT